METTYEKILKTYLNHLNSKIQLQRKKKIRNKFKLLLQLKKLKINKPKAYYYY